RKYQSSRRVLRTQCPMVLPDIPEKISLEDWSIKACYIEDIVYPSTRNWSYLTNSFTTAFGDPARWAGDSESSLLLSSITESSSVGSLPASGADPDRTADRAPTVTGLQCRRNENPDVLVSLGNANFPCHRAVLSLHSQYFKRILKANPRTQKLEIQGVSGDAFRVLLDYMYSGKLHMTCQNVGKLYVTASILRVPRVKHKCSKVGVSSLPSKEMLTACDAAVTHRTFYVIAPCLPSMNPSNLESAVISPKMSDDFIYITTIHLSHRLEMVIFLAALHWLNHNYLEHEAHVLRVLQCVRFSTMTSEELLRCLHPPLLPGIMEAHEVRSHIYAAICYKAAATYDQQHLFEESAEKPRYFKLDGPITLWDLDIFSPNRRADSGVKSCRLLKGLDASPNAVRRPPIANAQRSPLTASDPLCDYLVRQQSGGDRQVWSKDPYGALPCVAGPLRDPESAVIVSVGGYNPDTPFETATGNKILRYHVGNNKWEQYGSFPMPRHHHCAVLYEDEIFVIGGYDNCQTASGQLEPTNMCFAFDLSSKLWQLLPAMAHARAYHGAAIVGRTVYVLGGRSHDGRVLSSVETLAVGTKHWQELSARLCRPRMAAGLAFHRDRLWLAGGLSEALSGLVVISDVDCFDPRTYEFSFHVGFLPSPRCFFSLVEIGDRLFALGGCSADGSELRSLADVWACQDTSWDRRGALPTPCHDSAAVVLGRSVYLVGGLTSSTKTGLRSVCRYKATANAAQPDLSLLETPLCGTSLLVLPP
ncbi:unnamed protein product, partial [Ixodes hexagonus]